MAKATAEGIRAVADTIRTEGGMEAVQLRVAEQYITQFGHLAKTTNSLVIPTNLADVAAMIATAMSVVQRSGAPGSMPGRPAGPPASPAR